MALYSDSQLTAELADAARIVLHDRDGNRIELDFAQLRAVFRAAETALPWQP